MTRLASPQIAPERETNGGLTARLAFFRMHPPETPKPPPYGPLSAFGKIKGNHPCL